MLLQTIVPRQSNSSITFPAIEQTKMLLIQLSFSHERSEFERQKHIHLELHFWIFNRKTQTDNLLTCYLIANVIYYLYYNYLNILPIFPAKLLNVHIISLSSKDSGVLYHEQIVRTIVRTKELTTLVPRQSHNLNPSFNRWLSPIPHYE